VLGLIALLPSSQKNKRVESLIEREYLERDEHDRRSIWRGTSTTG
jgi:hypothetical protein